MLIPQNTIYGVWMRCPNVHGGKDWLGFVTGQHVISYWGRTGQVSQSKVLCNHPSRDDLRRKINEKLGKGYDIIAINHGATWSKPGSPQPEPQVEPSRSAQEAKTKENQQANALSQWIGGSSQAWF